MENFIFLLSESWSTMAADRLFSIFYLLNAENGIATPSTRMFFSVFQFFAATFLVAGLAWYATKKLAGARGIGRKAGNLAVIESVNVGGQAVVQLVKAGDKFLVVGVTRERVTLLAEVDKEQIVEPEIPDFKNLNTPFGKVLSRFIQPNEPPKGDEENDD